ncbi:uncharacterized protein TRIADDRAFT_59293 [Trichoplax adhaerens]|uniref:Amino acid transporter transmembrane domain-containing protein n=1 Tax=Trichoplax adhaerens TaxID=10228 RepID=B3S5E0_TRIAD|nr:hypothetical protein TRIADDRAFT_59293 [Trichoplax adhaerens]EDV22246.1 hypothetical protein TRIADDRAFT_59293 [Trichoplax adhaerens]|eukprot:XP_002115401.1 hypothetical protein TRIADDRAFT_59293 [Trichoplax adhaerens]
MEPYSFDEFAIYFQVSVENYDYLCIISEASNYLINKLNLNRIECKDFIVIAAIMGVGVLGLPVTLSHSGLGPLIFDVSLSCISQIIAMHAFLNLLQKAQVICKRKDWHQLLKPLQEIASDTDEEKTTAFDEKEGTQGDENEKKEKLINSGRKFSHDSDPSQPVNMEEIDLEQPLTDDGKNLEENEDSSDEEVNLYMISKLFLLPGVREIFDLTTIAVLTSLLISYVLAGSQAYGQLIQANYVNIIPFFTWFWAAFVLFLWFMVQPFVTVLTFVKCIMLLVTHYFIVYFVYSIGGVINVMPMMYNRIQAKPVQIQRFILAIDAALITVAIVDILWSDAVLGVVPQTCHPSPEQVSATVSPFATIDEVQHFCNVSLARARRHGIISTVVLTKTLRQHYPQYDWLAWLTESFISISITVSYLTMGSALIHLVNGLFHRMYEKVDQYFINREKQQLLANPRFSFLTPRILIQKLVEAIVFTIVFLVSLTNPEAFIKILNFFSSFCFNIQTGFFLPLMIYAAEHHEILKTVHIPYPMSRMTYYLTYVAASFYMFSCIFDLAEIPLAGLK